MSGPVGKGQACNRLRQRKARWNGSGEDDPMAATLPAITVASMSH